MSLKIYNILLGAHHDANVRPIEKATCVNADKRYPKCHSRVVNPMGRRTLSLILVSSSNFVKERF
eukprot:scaffold9573_cov119-Skeletonema_menzelii.AAC.1